MKKQLFFSHTWRPDNLFRDNHKRVVNLVNAMKMLNWTCWIDEDEMFGNIDACISNGINDCSCVLVFITENYCNKINEGANNPLIRDNCLKEWTYANNRNKLMIPIINEPVLLNSTCWPDGIINLYFGSTFYIDYTKDNVTDVARKLSFLLNKFNIIQEKKPIFYKNYKFYNYCNSLIFINKFKKKKLNILPDSPINISPNNSQNKLNELTNEHFSSENLEENVEKNLEENVEKNVEIYINNKIANKDTTETNLKLLNSLLNNKKIVKKKNLRKIIHI